MLKRFSSLILALLIGSNVLAGTEQPGNEHVCKMAGMEMAPGIHEKMPGMQMPAASPSLSPSHEMMPGMEMMDRGTMDRGEETTMPGMATMPCCRKHATRSVPDESGSAGQCCVNIPQETGSSRTPYNLRPPSFSIAIIHPAVAPSPLPVLKPYECSYSTEVFLPNLQASYIRNHSFLI